MPALAIFTALVSLLTDTPAASNLAMTGEITLRGLVLPVGGIKEKVLGAARAGIRTIILPERNAKDLAEVPEEIRDKMKFVVVGRMQEILPAALKSNGRVRRAAKRSRGKKGDKVSKSTPARKRADGK